MPVRWYITLSDEAADAVQRAVQRTGLSRSQLIDACITTYGPDVFQPDLNEPERLVAVMLTCLERLLPYLRPPGQGL